jgi:hypothetical protein
MRLLIYGSKTFAATVSELAVDCGHEPVGLIDDFSAEAGALGTFEDVCQTHPPQLFGIALAIGYTDIPARWRAWKKVRAAGYDAPTLIHPRAYVAKTARIGQGSIVMAGAIIDVRAELGEVVVAWPGVCVNHNAQVGSNTFLSPNSTLLGFSSIGPNSFVGAGSVVVEHTTLPAGSFVKALTCRKG